MFTSFRQCQATVNGQGGDCIQNPGMMAYDQSVGPRNRRMRDDNGWNNGGWDNRRW
jgi:hypothetical protein